MYHDNDIYITNIVYKHYEDSIFQRTVPLYATESFIKRVLKRGTSNESRALIEYDRLRFFAIQLVRVLGSLPL